jgi:hypothetical protein
VLEPLDEVPPVDGRSSGEDGIEAIDESVAEKELSPVGEVIEDHGNIEGANGGESGNCRGWRRNCTAAVLQDRSSVGWNCLSR